MAESRSKQCALPPRVPYKTVRAPPTHTLYEYRAAHRACRPCAVPTFGPCLGVCLGAPQAFEHRVPCRVVSFRFVSHRTIQHHAIPSHIACFSVSQSLARALLLLVFLLLLPPLRLFRSRPPRRKRFVQGVVQPLHLEGPHSGHQRQFVLGCARDSGHGRKLRPQVQRVRLVDAPVLGGAQDVGDLLQRVGGLSFLDAAGVPAVPDLVGFQVPGRLVLAPAQDQRQPVLHTERVELQQGIGVVVDVHQHQQDAQRKVVPQLGGSAMDVAGIELVVLAAQKEGAGGWTQHVAGDDRAVGNGDVLYQGEDRFSLFAGADV
mmetsp:Transcript_23738/g.48721  ORF Transcript_23738/g.48721 Transcript_23738/m.48721 type:complete len:318 (-) Transcript_23738:127-1080(-)